MALQKEIMLTEKMLSYKNIICEKKGSFISIYLNFIAVFEVFSLSKKKLQQIAYSC